MRELPRKYLVGATPLLRLRAPGIFRPEAARLRGSCRLRHRSDLAAFRAEEAAQRRNYNGVQRDSARVQETGRLPYEQDEKIQSRSVAIAKASEEIVMVAKSIHALAKALWGLAGPMAATLLGFVLWYIQSLAR